MFSCDQCDFKAAWKHSLSRHMQSIHEGIKKFPCDKCDYCGTLKENLVKHIKRMHKGDDKGVK